MTKYEVRSEWVKNYFQTTFGNKIELKLVHAKDGDLGDLDGFQFDAPNFGGFIYFWSSDVVEYHLVNYQSGIEVIPITVRDIEPDENIADVLMSLVVEVSDFCN